MTRTLKDTTGSEVVRALVSERRAAGAVASGLALTLVAVVDARHLAKAEAAATTAAAAHPCRVLVVVRRSVDAADRLDAEVAIGGRLGPIEAVVLRMTGRLTLHAESVVLPLLAPDAPVVTWWHGQAPERIAYDPLGVLAGRRITDAAASESPIAELKRRARDYAPGDTDLAWTRTTPWRALLASVFDDTAVGARSVMVSAEEGNPSAALLVGWLKNRLHVRARLTASDGPGITDVDVRLDSGDTLRIDRPDGRLATLHRSGRTARQLPLKRRELGDLLAEELRRLDADQPYGEALAAATGRRGLGERDPARTHVWRDPGQRAAAEAGR